MRLRNAFQSMAIALLCSALSAQTSVPAYSGVWKLDLKRSRIEAKNPPSSSITTIQYDGKIWNFSRTHHFLHKPADTWTTSMVVDAKQPRVSHEDGLTTSSRVTREGGEVVLHETYVADTGEKATNTVHYRLTDGGSTLIEDEQEVTSEGNEHNMWILKRMQK
jgi:hypothetical protein